MKTIIDKIEYSTIGKKTVICLVTLYNGFEIVGVSSCVDPEKFRKHVGEQLARNDAHRQVSLLAGFMDQQRGYLDMKDLPF